VLLVLVVAVGAFLFFPRGGNLSIATAATLTVLHGQVDAQKTGADFAPAFDGDLLTGGDVVRADAAGNAVVTFFDGSTLTVESGSQVKVASLTKTSSGGIQVAIEQTLGRTWASVQKLGSDSTFQIKTPTSTAAVRGTAFETVVETVNGVIATTIRTIEGQVVVQATSGGQTTVGPGEEVQVPQGAQAPANPTPQAPSPRLRFTPSANVGFTVIDPRGLQCSTTVRQIPGCNFNGAVVTIDGPAGSGKSTLARSLAPALGLPYLNTGLMYRAVARAAIERSVAADDEADVPALKGWRRELFGDKALALKHGQLALAVDKGRVVTVEKP